MTRLTKFALAFTAAYGLLFAVVSFLVSHVVGSFSWWGAAVGFAIGAALAVCKLPALIRDEIQRVYAALHYEWIVAVAKQCAEQGVELDISPLHEPVLAAAQAKLRSVTFHTLDLDEELRPHPLEASS